MSKNKNKEAYRFLRGVTAMSFCFISDNLSHTDAWCMEENAAFCQKMMEIK